MPPLKGPGGPAPGNPAIYGADETSMAESIASDALGSTKGTEDVWGARTDSRANSWDGSKEPQPGDVEVLKELRAGAGDDGNMDYNYSKVLPRHRTVTPAKDESTFVPPKRFSGTK
jgi:hypothetical protein